MVDNLGGRLSRVGLVTKADLAEIAATAPAHDAALVRAVVRRGVSEDAIVGFFLSEGFGPLLSAVDLARADPLWARHLPPPMALDFLAIPIRSTTDGVLVAMAAPSDTHLVRELSRVLGARAVATVARLSDIEQRLRDAHPDLASDRPRRPSSEPPVLELTRRRPSGFDSGFRPPDGQAEKLAKLGPRLALPDDEPAMPLVRHKPQIGSGLSERPAEVVVAKSFANPAGGRSEARGLWGRSDRPPNATAEYTRPSASEPVRAPTSTAPLAPLPAPTPAVATRAPSLDAAGPDSTASDERWNLPSERPSAGPGASAISARVPGANKLDARATLDLPTLKAAPGEIGTVLAGIRTAEERDSVVSLACAGATSVARSAVFFALRKGVLKGWDGAGPGVRRDSVRNLWIPTSSPSTFKKVLESRQGHVGPYGTSIADGLFRAAVGSRGGDLMIQPVLVGGKAVGFLCADDLRPGPIGTHRIEVLAQAVADAFVRIISAGKDP